MILMNLTISSQKTEPLPKITSINGSNLDSSSSLVKKIFSYGTLRKRKTCFVNEMNMHLKMICKSWKTFNFLKPSTVSYSSLALLHLPSTRLTTKAWLYLLSVLALDISYYIQKTILWRWFTYYLHFTWEETEA